MEQVLTYVLCCKTAGFGSTVSFMKSRPSLDTILQFLAVADAGGLSGAVHTTGSSAPTLSRRMTELEQQLGQRLFERGQRGYTLTAQGRALLDEAAPLRSTAERLNQFANAGTKPIVRISAGLWTSRFIAQNIGSVRSANAGWRPEMLASNATVDIARKEADIGIRNRRPDQSWLAGRKTLELSFAEYASSADVQGYVTLCAGGPKSASERWIMENHAESVSVTASDARVAADLARSGFGRIILPTFAGRSLAGLIQVSPIIPELTMQEWLVCHHDARHDPPIRSAINTLTTLLTDRTLRPAP